jgi:malonate-semialdehyde dehydrogenase (acetylating) / methylmalonate-semialdehyde dehydrogenase
MPTLEAVPQPRCPVRIGGEWLVPAHLDFTPVFNPSTGAVIAEAPAADAALVDTAVQNAHAAFANWSDTPPAQRARVFLRYQALLRRDFEDITALISREHGKTRAEARGDLTRGIEMVEYACGIPALLMGETLPNIASGIDCETVRHPLGVCVGITPFNFPAMVPLWMFPLALAAGNTFILKPSEKVPLTAERLVRVLAEAGLPPGVLNLVHGGRECVDALLTHPLVRAISFVGSTPVARHIYEIGTRYGKRVQAAGGAKNFVVVLPDADMSDAVRGLGEAAFGCAGERCMSGSTAVAVGAAHGPLTAGISEYARQLTVGRTDLDAQPGMGPVITGGHRNRVRRLIDEGEAAGATVVADGRRVRVPAAPEGFYVGATVLDGSRWDMSVMTEEIFGPVLNVMHAATLEEAIALANRSAFGNGASIFTRDGRAAREFKRRVHAGMIGINVGVPAPMAFFPFTGWGESFFGDLHIQGREGIAFYTQQKVTTTRWLAPDEGTIWSS